MENVLVNFDNFKRTWSVKAELPISFTVKYSSDIFNTTNQDLLSYSDSQRRLVVIDKTVYEIYKTELHNYFDRHKVQLELFVLDATEENKDWKHTDEVLKFFERVGVLRREPIVAIGGGVLLDLVGFCCSIYRRGIPYIKIPTTLLAIVDASVGVKVAANHLERRNRIGAYYPPIATFLDKKFIKTQNDRDIVNGIAEIFKLAVIKSEELFVLLEENYEQLINEKFQFGAVPVRVINLAITGMIEELAPNLWEKKLDRCVDFGHSFGPLIEMQNLPNLYHGEAVVLDCLYSSCIAEVRGYITMDQLRRIFKCAKNLKLPTWHEDFSKVRLLESALEDTKKHRNGNQYLPVPMGIGQYTMLNNVTVDEMRLAADLFEEIET
jgi:2-epi-5-epi-valiolone synthase